MPDNNLDGATGQTQGERQSAVPGSDPGTSDSGTIDPGFRRGVIIATLTYMAWGFAPIYFKLLADVTPFLVIAQRSIWVAVFLLIGMGVTGRTHLFLAVLRDPRTLAKLSLSGLLLAANWTGFFYAVATGRVLDSSLAYFITPLMAVLFGTMILREKLRLWQWISVATATLGVLITLFESGVSIGFLPIFLALSWAFYGMVRKFTQVDAFTGLLVESLVMAPLGIAFSFYLEFSGGMKLETLSIHTWILLVNTATITIFPLIGFAIATRLLTFSLLGLMNYISPFLQFLCAVVLFGEALNWVRLSSFAVIWLSLVIIAIDGWIHTRRQKHAASSV
ncbi:MAG: EamA family transporter RarD [Alphaproteobacteria bacterium]|nr:EamA family transporter RarD [Alphaproteobacteria bacterium]